MNVSDEATTEVPETDPLIQITSLEEFVRLLTSWHSKKVALLEHSLNIPEGTEVSLNDGTPLKLEGPMHTGYIIGLTVGLAELGILPFVTESAPAAEPCDEPIL